MSEIKPVADEAAVGKVAEAFGKLGSQFGEILAKRKEEKDSRNKVKATSKMHANQTSHEQELAKMVIADRAAAREHEVNMMNHALGTHHATDITVGTTSISRPTIVAVTAQKAAMKPAPKTKTSKPAASKPASRAASKPAAKPATKQKFNEAAADLYND